MSETNIVPERTHDQPAEGGRDTVEDALGETGADTEDRAGRADKAGIVDQQDAALDAMDRDSGTSP